MANLGRSTSLGIVAISAAGLSASGCDTPAEPCLSGCPPIATPATTTGAVRVSVTTTGGDVDRDGYHVTVDAAQQHAVGLNEAVVIPGLAAGTHTLELSSVADNCTVSGQKARSVSVTAGDTTRVAYAVSCAAIDHPDRSGIYERETPHSTAGRHSRYVIRSNGTFEVRDWTGADTTIYTGRWKPACCWGPWAIEPGSVLLLDFDGFQDDAFCGEGFGRFLLDGHLGIAYCGVMIRAGLEEGVYTSAPVPTSPGPPPPQSGQIAFVRDGRIYVANTDGGGVVQLSIGPGDGDPAWSPDGSRIAFTRASGGTSGVFIMDADGGNVVQRTTSGGDPTWSPDGHWIAFICRSPPGLGGVCRARAVDDGTPPVTIYEDAGQVYGPAWSPDGARIAYTHDWAMFDIWFDIWVVAPDGSQRTALTTHTPEAPNPYESYQPAWSPDGQRIAFTLCYWAFYFCSSSAVSVMNADGSGAVRLVAASGFASPTWSPDGQVIAFASNWPSTATHAIDWVSADGSQRGRIIDNGHSPAWRP